MGYSEIVNVFKQSGFYVDVSSIEQWDQPPINLGYLAEPFKKRSIDDLKVKQFDILARKS
jgi:hypothetical protein